MLKSNFRIYDTSNRGYKVLFFGTDEFSKQVLKRLNYEMQFNTIKQEKVIKSLGVACVNPQRTYPVLDVVQEYDLPCYEYPNFPADGYDIGIVASFGKLIPESIINSFPNGMVNIHPSLLPKFRGSSPIQSVILQNEEFTGVSIMKVTSKLDCGPVLSQTQSLRIPNHVSFKELSKILANYGADLLLDTLSAYSYKLENAKDQRELGDGIPTYTKKMIKGKYYINLSNTPFKKIFDHIRATGHVKDYAVYTKIFEKQVRLHEVELPSLQEVELLGEDQKVGDGFEYSKRHNRIYASTATTRLGIKTLSVKGRQKFSAKDFYNGYLQQTGLKPIEEKRHEQFETTVKHK